ncbi:hypothetical protein B0H13DRAFT_2079689, partial [Mycena leptocephala]
MRMYPHMFWVLTVLILPREYPALLLSAHKEKNGLTFPRTVSVPGTYLVVSVLHIRRCGRGRCPARRFLEWLGSPVAV